MVACSIVFLNVITVPFLLAKAASTTAAQRHSFSGFVRQTSLRQRTRVEELRSAAHWLLMVLKCWFFARTINVWTGIQVLGNLRQFRILNLVGLKPVKPLKAHNQRTPLVRVNAIRISIDQDGTLKMNT